MSYFRSSLHSHILSRRKLSEHFQTILPCNFCEKDIDDSTSMYCCQKCSFYIHTSCATHPPQIQHTLHAHPLHIQQLADERSSSFVYRCVALDRECDFELPAGYAMETLWVEKYYRSMLRDAGDGESRLQSAHEHPLTSSPVRTTIFCGACEMEISEEAYGCIECRFFLHESCANAPLEIQRHPFHLEHPLSLFYDSSSSAGICQACLSWCPRGIGYRCEECGLIFDLPCVISTMPCKDGDEREDIRRRPSAIDHPLHGHRLSSYHSKTQTRFECRICHSYIQSGDFFGCSYCLFFLHGSCAQPPTDVIQRYLHPEHPLTFAKFPDEKEGKCPTCEYPVRSNSYGYSCQMCDFSIHQTCASRTLSYLKEGEGVKVQFPFHEHELKLHYHRGDIAICSVCDGFISVKALAYRCISQGCKFELHTSCARLQSNMEHPSHSLHPLSLGFKPSSVDSICRSCDTRIRGLFAFSCGECRFHLHVDCAQIRLTLKHPLHEEHDLFYFEGKTYAHTNAEGGPYNECRACRRSCPIDLFRCVQCDFSLHYDCSQLPLTIKSERHWDPLVLRESYIEEIYTRHYCEICEKRRDPKKWIYFCETYNCELVAHVECALSPAKREVIEEDDFIIRAERIQTREKEIRDAQEKVDAKKASLRPHMEELESMRAELELQRLQLKELKTEHAKWINVGLIEEDESIGGEGDIDSTNDKLEKLKAILEDLETEQANWLIDFLKTECYLPTAFIPRTTGTSSSTSTAQSVDDYLI
ncbi:hypothetical protein BT93_H3711 [Corymbia citriodora subsp. variegata]|nr:hypothetical protein BT93_H3711 [Corymbia citriodora subsp. variegata]